MEKLNVTDTMNDLNGCFTVSVGVQSVSLSKINYRHCVTICSLD